MLVVVADKDPHDLDALRSAFESRDCEVETAFDGPVVLILARDRKPDAVVVNSSLGRMGGFAVARELKTSADLGEIPQLKIVVLLEREADAWLAAWSRCDAWRTKPVDPVDIAALVDELVAPPRAVV